LFQELELGSRVEEEVTIDTLGDDDAFVSVVVPEAGPDRRSFL
jgi:hypothetical protein